ncbi:hypothetical protein E2C01_052060 [Portunus trituberculatus]|uniref:Uncharacterized protein n=1 Tax=Portunus trituberculatus TaxID=210409 RepID=A0A5B7GKY3_PORTR|nr:hypothetical protein [Portunus trituberculatus]
MGTGCTSIQEKNGSSTKTSDRNQQ